MKKFALAVSAALLAACVAVGCSSAPSYKLTESASHTTSGGTKYEYKIDSSWQKDDFEIDAYGISSWSYNAKAGEKNTRINFFAKDTNGEYYTYVEEKTLDEWIEKEKEREETTERESDLTYSNVEFAEEGTKEASGIEFHILKETYTTTFDDEAFEKIKKNSPDAKQSEDRTDFYAVVKNGTHDIEISVSEDKQLLEDLLDTLTIID